MVEREFSHFYLYKKVKSPFGSSDCFNIKVYNDADSFFDMFLSATGAFRTEKQINFQICKTGEEFWSFLNDLRMFLHNNYNDSFLFSTGDNGASLIELTKEREQFNEST